MGKGRAIRKPDESRRQGLIPQSATLPNESDGKTDKENPTFSFKYADENRYSLSDWTKSEIKDLIRALKKIEGYTWEQIKKQGAKTRGESVGCGFKIIKDHPSLPEGVSKDVDISEMRICVTKRIFGFRVPRSSIYSIIWFDRNHSICK
jgi:hypothetical protein